MRVAVLVYGRLNKCVEHYQNIIENIRGDTDFFLSSDNSPMIHDFIRLYKPILYNNSPIKYTYDLGKYPGKRRETNIHNMTCHFINKNRVFVLLEEYISKTNTVYDMVLSLRIDCVFKTPFLTNVYNNTIYIPLGCDHIDNAINDQIAYGKVDVMKKYNSINAVDLLEKKCTIPHPESLTFANIRLHNLQVKRVSIPYYIER